MARLALGRKTGLLSQTPAQKQRATPEGLLYDSLWNPESSSSTSQAMPSANGEALHHLGRFLTHNSLASPKLGLSQSPGGLAGLHPASDSASPGAGPENVFLNRAHDSECVGNKEMNESVGPRGFPKDPEELSA